MGVSGEKYLTFKEFKRNVINIAVKEINEKADLFLEPQFKKEGRQIVAVKFILSENKNYQPTFRKIRREQQSVIALPKNASLKEILLTDLHLSELQVSSIIKKYPSEYILEKIQVVKNQSNVTHTGAYFISALNKNFKIKKTNTLPDNASLREAKAAFEIQPLKNKYLAYKIKAYQGFIQKQADSLQAVIKQKFEFFLQKKKEIFRAYKKTGLASPFVMSDFFAFIDKYFPHILGEYLSFDDYLTSDEH